MAEAAVGSKTDGARKRSGWFRTLLSRRREKSRAKLAATDSPTGYRTFSRKIAPSLLVIGGAAAVGGALGAWIRTSQVTAEALAEEQVGAVMGYEADWGRLLAVVAAISAITGVVWLWRGSWFTFSVKFVSVASVIAVIALTVWRLPIIDRQAAAIADAAANGSIDFVSFHAGFGWGAWLLVVASVSLFLGTSVALLRELDIRKGVPS